MPGARYARAIAANAGYYTLPATDAAYPYGLKGTPLATGINPTVFARDFQLLLGEAEVNSDAGPSTEDRLTGFILNLKLVFFNNESAYSSFHHEPQGHWQLSPYRHHQ